MADIENKIPFRVVRGEETTLLSKSKEDGTLYFATDTGKIYLDTIEEDKILMGGGANSGIFYAKKNFTNPADLTFSLEDITGDDLPKVNDLIINYSGDIGGDIERDGFYQVIEVITAENYVITNYLPVGGSGSGSGGQTGYAAIEYVYPETNVGATLLGKDYVIKYKLTAKDSAGDDRVNTGTATWIINGISIPGGQVSVGINSFNVKDYLDAARDVNTIKLSISIDTGGSINTVTTKIWQITAINLQVKWDFTFPHFITDETFIVSFTPYGNTDCVAHLVFDEDYSNDAKTYTLNVAAASSQKLVSFTNIPRFSHGTHSVRLWLTAVINGIEYRTEDIVHEIACVDISSTIPVITIDFTQETAAQWDTISIPYAVWASGGAATADVTIKASDAIVLDSKDCANMTGYEFNYTFGISGLIPFEITSGSAEKREFEVSVSPLALTGVTEPDGIAYKLKASDINSNADLLALANAGSITFSDNFDWINGGLQTETDDNGDIIKYICVKNGSTLTINYKLFGTNAATNGRNFKFIFKATNCYDYEAKVLDCYDEKTKIGIQMTAQDATFISSATVSTAYCEDARIEFEAEVWSKPKDGVDQYMMLWIDGVPNAIRVYTATDTFIQTNKQNITIGSDNCDVYVYLVKIYDRYLNDIEHLNNFILDAPSSREMLARFSRNNILDNNGEISYEKLVKNNPGCHAYLYDLPTGMTKDKDDKKACSYIEYCDNVEKPKYKSDNAQVYVQGTSSAAYGVAAYNLRTKFKNLQDGEGNALTGWQVDDASMPIDLACTKVNVASCENANNALNAWWYNEYQPYRDSHRRNNPQARDCMDFNFGVVFVKDGNSEITTPSTSDEYKTRNVFFDTDGYSKNPYYKQYSIGNMGNDKKNLEIFHDKGNSLCCCVEISDNQNTGHWMTTKIEGKDETKKKENFSEYYEFRYPDSITTDNLNNWIRFVNWMAENDPSPYDAINHPYGYKTKELYGEEAKLPETEIYGDYTFKGFNVEDGASTLKGVTINTYSGIYEYDCYERRMAKMLEECEDYLVMDSVVFHYLFILRHTMVDNVAKNTFWSTEDGMHWDLTKNYDNDTSDGNNNSGYLVYGYGLEIGDTNNGVSVFNASDSVWLNFIDGLYVAQQSLFKQLSNKGAWNSTKYLKLFKEKQALIPERCWIYDYQRKYIRPRRLGLDESTYLVRLDGGKKTYQRAQYEKYQEYYINSKYVAGDPFSDTGSIDLRLNYPKDNSKVWDENTVIPMSYYIDLYPSLNVGGKIWKKDSRLKRGEIFDIPIGKIVNKPTDATCYFYAASMITTMKKIANVYPSYLNLASANKLKAIEVGSSENDYYNNMLDNFGVANNTLLRELKAQQVGSNNLTSLEMLNLKSLEYIDIHKSSFTELAFAEGCILKEGHLNGLKTLTMTNMVDIEKLEFDEEIYTNLTNLYIDNCVGIDTYDLVNKCGDKNLQFYLLLGINWIINENKLTGSSLEQIEILDKLLKKSPKDGYTHKTALTGTITIDLGETAYTVDEYALYEKYHKAYPNVTINYAGNVAPNIAPKITFYEDDVNSRVLYEVLTDRKTSLEVLTSADGPSGEEMGKPVKVSGDIYEYFWNVAENEKDTYGDGETYSEVDWEDQNGVTYTHDEMLALVPTTDMTFTPVFSIKYRKYKVMAKDWDGSIIIDHSDGVSYGTVLTDIPKYVYRAHSNPTRRYEFMGWISAKDYLSGTTNPTYLTEFVITSDLTIYAQYKEQDIETTASRNEYFTFVSVSTTSPGYPGYQINLNDDYRFLLQGTITLPFTYNGQPIVEFGNFSPSRDNSGQSVEGTLLIDRITFLSTGNSSYISVANYAMACKGDGTATSNVTKINFPSTIAYIGESSFDYCSKLINVGELRNLEEVGTFAFQRCSRLLLDLDNCAELKKVGVGAFGWSNVTANKLPQNLANVSNWAFGNCRNVKISDFTSASTIGESAFSQVNLSKNYSEDITAIKFNASSVRTTDSVQQSVFYNYGGTKLTKVTIYYSEGEEMFNTDQKAKLGLPSLGITWSEKIKTNEGNET